MCQEKSGGIAAIVMDLCRGFKGRFRREFADVLPVNRRKFAI
jgi:hypothetical protein